MGVATDSPLLRRVPAAGVLAVSPRTLDRFVREGLVPVVRLGGSIRFHRDDLEALIERSRSVNENGP